MVAAVPLGAQTADSVVLSRIRAEVRVHSKVMRTATILSDVFGPRLAGSAEFDSASAWARRELSSYGLANVHREAWGTHRGAAWSVQQQSVELTVPYYARLVAYPKAWSHATNGVVRGTPMLIDVKSEADVAKYGDRLRGKIVLLGRPRPISADMSGPARHVFTERQLDSLANLKDAGTPHSYKEDYDDWTPGLAKRQRLYAALAHAGAAVTLEPSANPYATLDQAYVGYDTDVSHDVPGFMVALADYTRLVNLLELSGDAAARAPVIAVALASTFAHTAPRPGYNLIAELPGTDPTLKGEVVMLGAHFDSWIAGTGAADNAAGSAIAMEALRVLKAVGARPKRTIRIALWDGEEQEAYAGSLGYVRAHFGDPAAGTRRAEAARVAAYFNIDHGTGRVRGVWLQENSAARPALTEVLAPFADLGAAHIANANHGGTDHMPFVGVGIPAFDFLQDPLDYDAFVHHTNQDLAAWLVPDDLEQAVTVIAGVLYEAANRGERIPTTPPA